MAQELVQRHAILEPWTADCLERRAVEMGLEWPLPRVIPADKSAPCRVESGTGYLHVLCRVLVLLSELE